MAPLEDLERIYPIIDSDFRMFCASHGIFTDEDFLLHDLSALEAFAAPEKLKQGIKQIISIMESRQRPWLNGLELLEDAQLNKCTLSTGCERIDVLLQGGLREGHVTELVGPSCSGKTQVCLKAASHVARNSLGKVVYFDTGNSFSPKRIAQFLSLSSDASTAEIDFQVRMLIIDSLSSLIAPVLGGGGAHGHALMVTAGFLLKEIAHEFNVCVVVTNHMVAGEAGISKPALGESWKSIPHVRLLLSKKYSTNGTCITILKHPYLVGISSSRLLTLGMLFIHCITVSLTTRY
ncbi:DNA repair protein RAD51 homolog 4 isoform X3 [Salvia miltiorrhiza]|uniref:DNA repair protein RAD51 homolog 4 isoform X3 n=1 Tax=Salvia miltiorrhiza TaxID=226208 RepID=UPI0025AC67A5|nr:DNA repair protein RAD51 homolog 4 isoform X3 [Salvia miltiorrhiza]